MLLISDNISAISSLVSFVYALLFLTSIRTSRRLKFGVENIPIFNLRILGIIEARITSLSVNVLIPDFSHASVICCECIAAIINPSLASFSALERLLN